MMLNIVDKINKNKKKIITLSNDIEYMKKQYNEQKYERKIEKNIRNIRKLQKAIEKMTEK